MPPRELHGLKPILRFNVLSGHLDEGGDGGDEYVHCAANVQGADNVFIVANEIGMWVGVPGGGVFGGIVRGVVGLYADEFVCLGIVEKDLPGAAAIKRADVLIEGKVAAIGGAVGMGGAGVGDHAASAGLQVVAGDAKAGSFGTFGIGTVI